jgi:hypothetical protein
LCTVIQLPAITPKQDGEVCTKLIDAVGQLRFIQIYSVQNSDLRERNYLYIRDSQKARPSIVYCMLFIMWTRENFTDLQYIIAESSRVAIFEWSPACCRMSSVTSETACIPPEKSCYPCSAAIKTKLNSLA